MPASAGLQADPIHRWQHRSPEKILGQCVVSDEFLERRGNRLRPKTSPVVEPGWHRRSEVPVPQAASAFGDFRSISGTGIINLWVPFGFSEIRKQVLPRCVANFGKVGAQRVIRYRSSIRSQSSEETFSVTLTVAHISPIMSVIAGLLILIMPRLLNLVVAIFLILNGLIGLGLLKWLHM
jgi:hypothetical protein